MTKNQKSLLKIAAATAVATLLVWLLWPAGPAGPAPEEAELPPATVEGEVGAETPLDLNGEPLNDDRPQTPPRNEAKLPAPNSAELVRLHEEALAGNRESLEEVCRYVTGADLYDLGDFKPDDELVSACAELRPGEGE